MINQTVYIKFNSYRKHRFNLRTEIRIEKGKKYVYKIASYKEGRIFIQTIYDNYKKLCKLNLPFEINKCKRIDESTLRFDYIKGKSLFTEFEEIVKKNNKEEFFLKLKKFEELLNNLPGKKESLDKNFRKVFGPHENNIRYDLLLPGILDLNLDNIIKDNKGKLHLLDYEWCFNFGIPKRYILFRTIFNSTIQSKFLNSNFISLKILKSKFSYTKSDIMSYLKMENFFQKYVTDNNYNIEDYIKKNTLNITQNEKKKSLILTQNEYDEKINSLKNMYNDKIDSLEKTLTENENQLQKTNSEVEEFRSFKKGSFWKFLKKYRVLKTSIKNWSKKNNEK